MSDVKRMVAFAIGVGEAKPLPFLSGAVNGARQFHQWASTLGYKSRLIIDDPLPVTIDRLRSELMSELQLQSSPIYRLVIYFAGHGLIREAEEGLWLPSDWNSQLRAVAVEVLKRRLYRFGVGHIAIFSDSCRSLPADFDAADLTPDPVLGRGPSASNDPPIDKFIAAQDGSSTFMIPGENPEEDRCLFSGVLMEGLWGLNRSAFSKVVLGKITSRSLGAFLKTEVPKRAKQYKQVLSPSIQPTFPEGDDIYFEDGTAITPPPMPPWPPTLSPANSGEDQQDRLESISARLNTTDSIPTSWSTPGSSETVPTISRGGMKKSVKKTSRKGFQQELQDSPPSLLEKIRSQSRPARFETDCGFAVDGGSVVDLWTPADLFAELHGAPNWWRIGHRSSFQLLTSAPVLVEFEGGTFAAVTALPTFITTLVRERRGVTALIYRQIDAPMQAAAAAENAVAQLESGMLRADAAIDLATQIRKLKYRDPVLGAISAYLYDSIGDVESIRRTAYFYVMNKQPIPYDIALLGQLQGQQSNDGPISAIVPAVGAHKPRTKEEKDHSWTHSATKTVTGEVGGLWPWMRQGWGFLGDWDDDSILVPPGLAELTKNLTSARFATLDANGGHTLAELFRLRPQSIGHAGRTQLPPTLARTKTSKPAKKLQKNSKRSKAAKNGGRLD